MNPSNQAGFAAPARHTRRALLPAWLGLIVFACSAGQAAAAVVVEVPPMERVQPSPLAEAAMAGNLQRMHALLAEGGHDVNAGGWDGTPALHWVARMGDIAAGQALLEAGADVDAVNPQGLVPLHVALEHGHARFVQWLLDAGANPDLPNPAGLPPLALAARSGDVPTVEALLARGADIERVDRTYDLTPLMIAVQAGELAVVRLLVDAGADIHARSRQGEVPEWVTPDQIPMGLSRGIGIIRGGWPEHGKRNPIAGYKTPLLYATRNGHLEITRLLVEAGADLEAADANGITPLINAIINTSVVAVNSSGRSDHLRIAQYLVGAGADVNAMDWYGQTPLWAAIDIRNHPYRDGRDPRVDRQLALQLIDQLLEAGADVNARTKEHPPTRRFLVGIGSYTWVDLSGQTPFLRAAASGDLVVMRRLLERGADPNIGSYAGTTPLMVAAGVNWAVAETFDWGDDALLEAVKLTHSLGNDVNAENSMGLRAVHGAANRGANDVIEYLAHNGAALDTPDEHGRTPLTWAEGVFLASHSAVRKPETIALLTQLQQEVAANTR